jgi:deaminated glutathione amidase
MQMDALKIAVVQMCSSIDVQSNLQQAAELIQQAAQQGCECVLLPENFASMGGDHAYRQRLIEADGEGEVQSFLAHQARRCGLYLVGGTLPIRVPTEPTKAFAACCIYDPKGQRIARYDKVHLFDVQLSATEKYAESDYTQAGDALLVTFGMGQFQAAPAVCYDLRFAEFFRPPKGIERHLWFIPAAFTETTGRAHWEVLLRARAIENQCYIAASNQGGVHEDGRETYGHSMVVDPWGKILVQAEREPTVLMCDLDWTQLNKVRQQMPMDQHRTL